MYGQRCQFKHDARESNEGQSYSYKLRVSILPEQYLENLTYVASKSPNNRDFRLSVFSSIPVEEEVAVELPKSKALFLKNKEEGLWSCDASEEASETTASDSEGLSDHEMIEEIDLVKELLA